MATPKLDDVRELISKQAGVPVGKVTVDSKLEDLGLESKDISTVLTQAEAKWGVKLQAESFAACKTVGDLYNVAARAK